MDRREGHSGELCGSHHLGTDLPLCWASTSGVGDPSELTVLLVGWAQVWGPGQVFGWW